MRGVLLVGAGGRAFVAGADIRGLSSALARGGGRARRGAGTARPRPIEALPAPVIACVDGFALGGGLELALACDLIYATDGSSFGQPEVQLGLIPGFGGTVRLPRAVGLARAKELIYTGRRIGIDEAVDAGLVARRFADRDALLAGARETIAEIAANSPTAVGLAKRVLVAATGQPTEVATALEVAGFEDAFRTDDMREGVAAFLEKREPRFGERLTRDGRQAVVSRSSTPRRVDVPALSRCARRARRTRRTARRRRRTSRGAGAVRWTGRSCRRGRSAGPR